MSDCWVDTSLNLILERKGEKMDNQRFTADRLNIDGCINLIQTLLEDWCNDFRSSIKAYKKNPNDVEAKKRYLYIRSTLLSDYFANLTCMDGNAIVNSIEYEYGGVHIDNKRSV